MQRSLEQRYAIKFCVKLGKSATETFDMIKQAYPDVALARSGVFRWHQAFLEGREEVADEDRAGRPSTSTNTDNVTRVHKVLNSDRRLSIRLIAQMLNLPKSVVHDIVTEHLNMRKVSHRLSCEQLPDQGRHPNASAAALQPRCGPPGLFFVSSPEKADERQAF
ncbi:PREDICTED: putative uncharacterized protein FLJ37770 [Trachymyrmex septentrionalis]|nr:PREDICTED: putative uncharacterized protein FLJ37770 [Trachymyrmex septentrionalis]